MYAVPMNSLYIPYLFPTSEVGGSEFAFRQAPPDREIVSCRACVRAVWLPSRIPGQNSVSRRSLFPFGLPAFPFSLLS